MHVKQQISHSKGLEKQSLKFLDEYIDDAKGLGIIYSCSKGEYSLDELIGHSISCVYIFDCASIEWAY